MAKSIAATTSANGMLQKVPFFHSMPFLGALDARVAVHLGAVQPLLEAVGEGTPIPASVIKNASLPLLAVVEKKLAKELSQDVARHGPPPMRAGIAVIRSALLLLARDCAEVTAVHFYLRGGVGATVSLENVLVFDHLLKALNWVDALAEKTPVNAQGAPAGGPRRRPH
jgi:hypothetical protein